MEVGKEFIFKEANRGNLKRLARQEIQSNIDNLSLDDKKVDKTMSFEERVLGNALFLNESLGKLTALQEYLSVTDKEILLTGSRASPVVEVATLGFLSGNSFVYEKGKGVRFHYVGGRDTKTKVSIAPDPTSIERHWPNTLNNFAKMSKEDLLKKVLRQI